jgi:hypothetical protein
MSEISQHLIEKAADIICQFECHERKPGGLKMCDWAERHLACARVVLEKAEQAWPHNPPQRDPASCTSINTQQAWTPSIGFTGRLRRDPLHVTS